MDILTHLRKRIAGFSLEASIPLLRRLGCGGHDTLVVLTHRGHYNMSARELVKHFDRSIPVDRIRPVYFYGGPLLAKRFTGSYLTFLVDRAMHRACEKGWAAVDTVLIICEGERLC